MATNISRADVAGILSAVLGVEVATHRDTLREEVPSWDSLKHMELVFTLEDAFGVLISERDIGLLVSVDTIVSALENLRAA